MNRVVRVLLPLLLLLSVCWAGSAEAQRVVEHGEIVIMEGDSALVSGEAGNRVIGGEQQLAIVNRFLEHYPDEFDELIVWPTFNDLGVGGAYFTSNVPATSERLYGFVNMNQVGTFGAGVIPVLGQEFSHAWLAFASMIDPGTGTVSQELLGRMSAHWSQLMDAEGSVQDGPDWVDNGDGTYTVVGYMNKFSPLDLYLMGFLDPDEVPGFFVLRNAVAEGGGSIGPLGPVNVGTTATADRVDISVQDIIAAEGGLPPASERQHDFRVAFVLITEPGVTAEQVFPTADQLDVIRLQWNQTAEEWFQNRGTMCSDVTVPCDIPHAKFVTGRFLEGEPSDGDGIPEPGEHAVVEVTWVNTGIGETAGATASLAPADERIVAPPDAVITTMSQGGEGTSVQDIEVPKDIECGDPIDFTATSHVGERTFTPGDLTFIPGVVEGPIDGFATDGGYRANVEMADTANAGAWDYGPAELIEHEGRTLQPNGAAGGETDSAWWTGREMGFDWKANDVDTGFTTLTSMPMDLSAMYEPKLRYSVWYVALSFNGPEPVPTDGDELVVEASSDDGVTWTEIDRVEGDPRAWERREAPFANVDTGAPVRVRFVATDQGSEQNLVEVGIDDVQIVSLSKDCEGGGGGCGCKVGGPGTGGTAAFVLFALGLIAVRSRSRSRSRS